jgi:hypothetical protein
LVFDFLYYFLIAVMFAWGQRYYVFMVLVLLPFLFSKRCMVLGRVGMIEVFLWLLGFYHWFYLACFACIHLDVGGLMVSWRFVVLGSV